jgi:hypothetical protein
MSTHPYLIGPAGFGQVSHPFDTVIIALFKYFQKPHNQPRRGKHKDLEINIYGGSSPDLASCCTGKLRSPIERELLSSLDSRNPAHALSTGVNGVPNGLLPHNDVFFWNIFRFPRLDFAVDAGRIQGRRYAKDHVSGGEFVSKIRLHDDEIRDLRRSNLIDGGNHSQG